MKKQFSLDGGHSWQDFDQLRIYCEIEHFPGEDEEGGGDLCFNFTQEGLIIDLWEDDERLGSVNPGTSSETYDEIVERLIESNG